MLVTFLVIALFALVYFHSAQPIRAAYFGDSHLAHLSRRFHELGLVVLITAWLHRLLANAATRYLALMSNDDPYASKAFAKPGSVVDSVKILISERAVCHDVLLGWAGGQ